MPAFFLEREREIEIEPLMLGAAYEFSYRFRPTETAEFDEWINSPIQGSNKFRFPVSASGGIYETRARIAEIGGNAIGEWGYDDAITVPEASYSANTFTNVEFIDPPGCPNVEGRAIGLLISWDDTSGKRFNARVGEGWTEAATTPNSGVAWRRKQMMIVKPADANAVINLGGAGDANAVVPRWFMGRGQNDDGYATSIDFASTGWNMVKGGSFRVDNPICAISGPAIRKGVDGLDVDLDVGRVGNRLQVTCSAPMQSRFFTGTVTNPHLSQVRILGNPPNRIEVRLASDEATAGGLGPDFASPTDWRFAIQINDLEWSLSVAATDPTEPYLMQNLPASLVTHLTTMRTDVFAGTPRTISFAFLNPTIATVGNREPFETPDDEVWFSLKEPLSVPDVDMLDWLHRAIPASPTFTVALLDRDRRCFNDPLLNVQVELDVPNVIRQRIFTKSSAPTIANNLVPQQDWPYGLPSYRQPETGSPFALYTEALPSIVSGEFRLEFFRDVTGIEIRDGLTISDQWKGPLTTSISGATQAHVYRAGTATAPAISGMGPEAPSGWSTFVPETTTANPVVWEAVSSVVGGVWTSWGVVPQAAGAQRNEVYLTQIEYDALTTKDPNTSYFIYD